MKTKPIVLFDIDYTLFNMAHFRESKLTEFLLYEEVKEVLEKLLPVAELGIFSEALSTIEWQQKKLAETKIEHFFEKAHTYIVKTNPNLTKGDMAKTILKKYRDSDLVFLIDDKLTFLHEAKKILPSLQTVWVKRGWFAMKQTPIPGFTPDFEIKSLEEVLSIIY